MKAIVTELFGHPPEMAVRERPKPTTIREGHTLVRMHAATINQLSNTIRLGDIIEQDGPIVLGNEGSGVVEESNAFLPGTRVAIYGGGDLGITSDGTYQEWIVVEDRRLLRLPETVSLDEGAALTVNYLTAYGALTSAAEIKTGELVLVSGATGGVGHALMQTATALGAHPIAVVSSASKAARARLAGATAVIDLSSQDLPEEVERLTGGKGVALALDPVGGDYVGQFMSVLRPGGTLVSIGFTGGKTPRVDLVDIVSQEKGIRGYALHRESQDVTAMNLIAISDLAAQGHLKPVIDSRIGLDDFERGYERLMSRQAVGSILLTL
ncbi:quinone oxidoreductase family protein [Arthrobacter sp. KNU40]|uniref:quinone oxidoreductase family protein n=1 Tax=Arthrobacter sp. KNU40 TaxID=3447965 RepID=UPI003F63202C